MKKKVYITRDEYGNYVIFLKKPKFNSLYGSWNGEIFLMDLNSKCLKRWLNLKRHLKRGINGISEGNLYVEFVPDSLRKKSEELYSKKN